MRSDRRAAGLRSARGLVRAGLIAALLLSVGWLCFRSALERALPPASAAATRFLPRADAVVLGNATGDLVAQRGLLPPATLAAVRRAAATAPLDARPYLILGHQQLLDRQPDRAVATLEKGQRLDPRQRLIHLLLLDRYLRGGRYTDAAAQFAVLARLVGSTQAPIAQAMAQMSQTPETREAVLRTLRADPALEMTVLRALAKTDTDPAAIFALASPRARATAGQDDGWGRALVTRLADRGRYAQARAIWRQVYRLPEAAAASLLYDPGLAGLPGSPPFNWTFAASSIGAVDLRGGAMAIDYYGRESGELAGQTLTLRPGAYRFAFTAEGAKSATPSGLFWTLRCVGAKGAEIFRTPIQGSGAPRRAQVAFSVPAGCPAQRLLVIGEAGEFPTPSAITVRNLELAAVAGRAS